MTNTLSRPALPDPRRELVLRDVDMAGDGLEIGPSYSPLLPKASFPGVRVMDHADAETLRAKYRNMGLAEDLVGQIEEVDFQWTGGSLVGAIPDGQTFSFIVGSHLIEHTVDLIGFLQDCQTMLSPGGRLVLFVPDMRRCFDCLQSPTSIGSVIDAHDRPTVFHPPGALLDHLFYATKRGDALAWGRANLSPLELQFQDISLADQWRSLANEQAEYFDVHRWRFTPTSLQLLLRDLASMGLHQLRPLREPRSLGHEFTLTLERDDEYLPGFDPEWRLGQLRKIDEERGRAFTKTPAARPAAWARRVSNRLRRRSRRTT